MIDGSTCNRQSRHGDGRGRWGRRATEDTHYSPETRVRAERMHAEGWSISRISQTLRIPYRTAYGWLRNPGADAGESDA